MKDGKPCLNFTGAIREDGYGQVSHKRYGTQAAHRVAYIEAYGPIPKGMHVLHRCDVKSCIEPTHLWLGTHADNMADMKAKGRANGNTTLTEKDVRRIKRMLKRGRLSQQQIADRLGVKQAAISKIKLKQRWSHI